MPQMNKGGKFIFGKSLIREDGSIRFPAQAIDEYHITAEGKVYLFTGSKSTGGFCVTGRRNCPDRGYDGLFENRTGNEAAFHPQQRYCFYDGRKGAAGGGIYETRGRNIGVLIVPV